MFAATVVAAVLTSLGAIPAAATTATDNTAIGTNATGINATGSGSGAVASPQATWVRTGRPDRMIIVRPNNIDTVTAGQLTRRTPRPAGPLTLAALVRHVPTGWLTLPGDGSAELSASVVLTANTSLDNGREVHILRLVGSTTPGSAASIWVGRGHLTLRDVTLTSADPLPQQIPQSPAPERGFLIVDSGGTLDITDATLADLGTALPTPPPTTSPSDASSSAVASGKRVGVVFGPGSTGSIVRSTMVGNGIGLKLAGSQDVQLDTVTLARSQSAGLVLHGDRGTTMRAVRSVSNAGDGVLVTGPSTDRPIADVSTESNGGFGVAVNRQDRPHITGVTSSGNWAGGLRLTASTAATVVGLTSTDDPVGLLIDGISTHPRLTAVHTRGGQRGIVLTAGVNDVELSDSVVEDAAAAGVTTAATGTRITGGRITGGATGIKARAATDISGLVISGVGRGIHASPSARVTGERIDVHATSSGIKVDPSGEFVLTDSSVRARSALRGQVTLLGANTISLRPFNWFGAFGVLFLVLAVLLELVHLIRQRRQTRTALGAATGEVATQVFAGRSARGGRHRAGSGAAGS